MPSKTSNKAAAFETRKKKAKKGQKQNRQSSATPGSARASPAAPRSGSTPEAQASSPPASPSSTTSDTSVTSPTARRQPSSFPAPTFPSLAAATTHSQLMHQRTLAWDTTASSTTNSMGSTPTPARAAIAQIPQQPAQPTSAAPTTASTGSVMQENSKLQPGDHAEIGHLCLLCGHVHNYRTRCKKCTTCASIHGAPVDGECTRVAGAPSSEHTVEVLQSGQASSSGAESNDGPPPQKHIVDNGKYKLVTRPGQHLNVPSTGHLGPTGSNARVLTTTPAPTTVPALTTMPTPIETPALIRTPAPIPTPASTTAPGSALSFFGAQSTTFTAGSHYARPSTNRLEAMPQPSFGLSAGHIRPGLQTVQRQLQGFGNLSSARPATAFASNEQSTHLQPRGSSNASPAGLVTTSPVFKITPEEMARFRQQNGLPQQAGQGIGTAPSLGNSTLQVPVNAAAHAPSAPMSSALGPGRGPPPDYWPSMFSQRPIAALNASNLANSVTSASTNTPFRSTPLSMESRIDGSGSASQPMLGSAAITNGTFGFGIPIPNATSGLPASQVQDSQEAAGTELQHPAPSPPMTTEQSKDVPSQDSRNEQNTVTSEDSSTLTNDETIQAQPQGAPQEADSGEQKPQDSTTAVRSDSGPRPASAASHPRTAIPTTGVSSSRWAQPTSEPAESSTAQPGAAQASSSPAVASPATSATLSPGLQSASNGSAQPSSQLHPAQAVLPPQNAAEIAEFPEKRSDVAIEPKDAEKAAESTSEVAPSVSKDDVAGNARTGAENSEVRIPEATASSASSDAQSPGRDTVCPRPQPGQAAIKDDEDADSQAEQGESGPAVSSRSNTPDISADDSPGDIQTTGDRQNVQTDGDSIQRSISNDTLFADGDIHVPVGRTISRGSLLAGHGHGNSVRRMVSRENLFSGNSAERSASGVDGEQTIKAQELEQHRQNETDAETGEYAPINESAAPAFQIENSDPTDVAQQDSSPSANNLTVADPHTHEQEHFATTSDAARDLQRDLEDVPAPVSANDSSADSTHSAKGAMPRDSAGEIDTRTAGDSAPCTILGLTEPAGGRAQQISTTASLEKSPGAPAETHTTTDSNSPHEEATENVDATSTLVAPTAASSTRGDACSTTEDGPVPEQVITSAGHSPIMSITTGGTGAPSRSPVRARLTVASRSPPRRSLAYPKVFFTDFASSNHNEDQGDDERDVKPTISITNSARSTLDDATGNQKVGRWMENQIKLAQGGQPEDPAGNDDPDDGNDNPDRDGKKQPDKVSNNDKSDGCDELGGDDKAREDASESYEAGHGPHDDGGASHNAGDEAHGDSDNSLEKDGTNDRPEFNANDESDGEDHSHDEETSAAQGNEEDDTTVGDPSAKAPSSEQLVQSPEGDASPSGLSAPATPSMSQHIPSRDNEQTCAEDDEYAPRQPEPRFAAAAPSDDPHGDDSSSSDGEDDENSGDGHSGLEDRKREAEDDANGRQDKSTADNDEESRQNSMVDGDENVREESRAANTAAHDVSSSGQPATSSSDSATNSEQEISDLRHDPSAAPAQQHERTESEAAAQDLAAVKRPSPLGSAPLHAESRPGVNEVACECEDIHPGVLDDKSLKGHTEPTTPLASHAINTSQSASTSAFGDSHLVVAKESAEPTTMRASTESKAVMDLPSHEPKKLNYSGWDALLRPRTLIAILVLGCILLAIRRYLPLKFQALQDHDTGTLGLWDKISGEFKQVRVDLADIKDLNTAAQKRHDAEIASLKRDLNSAFPATKNSAALSALERIHRITVLFAELDRHSQGLKLARTALNITINECEKRVNKFRERTKADKSETLVSLIDKNMQEYGRKRAVKSPKEIGLFGFTLADSATKLVESSGKLLSDLGKTEQHHVWWDLRHKGCNNGLLGRFLCERPDHYRRLEFLQEFISSLALSAKENFKQSQDLGEAVSHVPPAVLGMILQRNLFEENLSHVRIGVVDQHLWYDNFSEHMRTEKEDFHVSLSSQAVASLFANYGLWVDVHNIIDSTTNLLRAITAEAEALEDQLQEPNAPLQLTQDWDLRKDILNAIDLARRAIMNMSPPEWVTYKTIQVAANSWKDPLDHLPAPPALTLDGDEHGSANLELGGEPEAIAPGGSESTGFEENTRIDHDEAVVQSEASTSAGSPHLPVTVL